MSNITTSRTASVALATLVVGLLLAAGGSYLFAAWSGPTQAPPGGNVDAPINVGTVGQEKLGMFAALGGVFRNGGLSVNTARLSDGSASPNGAALKLDVEGAVGATKYCDEEGLNCKDIADVGGGGSVGSCTYDTCYWSGCSDTNISCRQNEIMKGINPQECNHNVAASIQCCVLRCGGEPLAPTPVNASCGTLVSDWEKPDPRFDVLCSAGSEPVANQIIGDTTIGWDYTCGGLYGGNNAQCHVDARPANPVNGTCKNPPHTKQGCGAPNGTLCATGNATSPVYSNVNDRYEWRCNGTEGGSNSGTCWFGQGGCSPPPYSGP